MVIELILNPPKASIFDVAILSIAFSFLSVVISHALFPQQSSVLSVAFITIFFVPFFQKLFESDEKSELKIKKGNLISRHSHTIKIFSAFFLGTAISLSFLHVFFPQYSSVFSLQTEVLEGLATDPGSNFYRFLANNSQLMIIIWAFSVVFGSGAVFILAWNASVMSVFASTFIKHLIEQGWGTSYAYAIGLPLSLGQIALHGIPEIAAYFIAGLGGGILSVGILREQGWTKNMKHIAKDSVAFLIIAEVMIIAAAWLEAFV